MANCDFKEIASKVAKRKGFSNLTFVAEGAFKETFSAKSDDFGTVALKIMDPDKCDMCRTDREIEAMKKCDSPFIAKLLDYGRFGHGGIEYIFTVEEFLDGGTLSDKYQSGKLSPTTIRGYGIKLTKGIGHLKELNLVHRDIKPDNIMFRHSSETPIFVDFGLVRDLTRSSLTQTWIPLGPCTPFFAAPEQLNNEKRLIGWRTDQFGLGIVLGFCLTGKHPYQGQNMTETQVIEAVATRQYCSDNFQALVKSVNLECLLEMIEPWPIRRYSQPEQLLEAFQMEI